MTRRIFQFALRDLGEFTFASALTAWSLSWPIWSYQDRVVLLTLAVGAVPILWIALRLPPRHAPAGYFSASFAGAVAGVLQGPLLLTSLWPNQFVDPGLPVKLLLATSFRASIYLTAIVALSFLGAAGAFLFGSSYLLLVAAWGSLRRTYKASTGSETKRSPAAPLLFLIRGACLLSIVVAWRLQIPELRERGTIEMAESMRRPWDFTADGRFLGYLDVDGTLRLFESETARLSQTQPLQTKRSTPDMGTNTYPELARQMWFLPGGRQLLLDCWPFGFVTIDTTTWREETPRNAGRHAGRLNREERRGVSTSGRILVTSPEHRAHEFQNNTTLTIWDMTAHAPLRKISIRPRHHLSIYDDTVSINDGGDVLVLSVQRPGSSPKVGTEIWDLDSGSQRRHEILNFAKLDAAGQRVAHFHFSLDLKTGRQRQILSRASVIDFSPDGRRLLAFHGRSKKQNVPVLGSLIAGAFDDRLLVYDAAGKRILAKSTRVGNEGPESDSDFNIAPDGRHVAVRLAGRTIRIFRMR